MPARRGQSILEYTIIIGIVTVVLYYMGTSIKRGYQSMIKLTADQVGNQQNADQDFSSVQQGYMLQSNSQAEQSRNKRVRETGDITAGTDYVANTSYNDSTDIQTSTITNGGFSPGN